MESHSKTCTKCKEVKPQTEFSKNRKAKDGLQYKCKECQRQYYQENHERLLEYKKQYYQENHERLLEYKKQWRQENLEQISEYHKQYRQENREQISEYDKQYRQENRERLLEYRKQYYQENRDQRLEYGKQYYQENREQISEYHKQYRQENREQFLARSAKHRALKREAVPEALADCPEEKDRVNKIYKLRELLTRATGVEYHVDHIWPLSKGGPHWSGNLQIITAEENLSKSDSFCEDTARVIEESLYEYLSARQ